jgi:hypothetical protein
MPLDNELLSSIMGKMNAGTDATAAVDAIAIWSALARKFGPLIGPGSVSLLLARSLELHKAAFPWLPPASRPGVAQPPFAALQAALEGQPASEVITATGALLNTYSDLLSTLIGARLTAQFLRSAFPDDGAHENTWREPG